MRELAESRQTQELEKQKKLAEQAKQERDEFLRIIAKQKLELEQDHRLEEERKKIREEHAKDLKSIVKMMIG